MIFKSKFVSLCLCSSHECGQYSTRRFAAFAFNKLRDDKPRETKNHGKRNSKNKRVRNSEDLLIDCNRTQFNLSKSQAGTYNGENLASMAWMNRKSIGDYFIIRALKKDVPDAEDIKTSSFMEAGLTADIENVIHSQGFASPTEIQVQGIKPILEGHNVLLAAETGCGKTLAYLLPLIQQIKEWQPYMEAIPNAPLGIIVSPSRELAYQIADVAKVLGKELHFSTKVLIGGRTKKIMMNPTFEESDLLVATMGALSKLTTTRIYNLSLVRHVVLDEADTLLDDSFNEKLRHWLGKIPFQYQCHRNPGEKPEGAQLTLASATMPTSIEPILKGIIEEKSLVKITTPGLHRVMPNVSQKFMRVAKSHKPEELLKIAKAADASKVPLLIFSNKSSTSDWISMFLNESGVKCVNLNGEMPLVFRQGTFKKFQDGAVNILSTTDVGSRGLNTLRAELVLNYEFPFYMADYIHRCGRIGRVGSHSQGRIINLICGTIETKLVQSIETAVRKQIPLSHVNNNITKLIEDETLKRMQKQNDY